MKTIYKYELEIADQQSIMMLKDFEILSVQVQDKKVCLWCLVGTNNAVSPYKFFIVGTGEVASHVCKSGYVGTFQLYDGGFVGHLFQDLPRSID